MAVAHPIDKAHLDEIRVLRFGTTPYQDALVTQSLIRARRRSDEVPDTLLLLEHPAVYTLGRRTGAGEMTVSEEFCRAHGIEIVPTKRGGKITYHGPGQLVGYPIMCVHDIDAHLRKMEAAIVAALTEYDIEARSRRAEGIDYTGVWVQDRKIASIGVHVSRGVSTHGFAVNVTNDLEPFSWIVPCGLPGVRMTSIAQEIGHEPNGGLDAFADLLTRCFCETHGRIPRTVPVWVSSSQTP